MKNARFFTLIEVLATMTIIAILSIIGYGSYSYATNAAKKARTETLFKNLEAGLENLSGKVGYYPGSAGGEFSPIIVTLGDDKTVGRISFGGTIIEDGDDPVKKAQFDAFAKGADLEQLKQSRDNAGRLIDAWGGVIAYRAPSTFTGNYDLLSAGPDGTFSSDNATDPNTVTDDGKYPDASGVPLCDDLFNF